MPEVALAGNGICVACLVIMQSHVFSSFVRMMKTLWIVVIKGRHTLELMQDPSPPWVSERH